MAQGPLALTLTIDKVGSGRSEPPQGLYSFSPWLSVPSIKTWKYTAHISVKCPHLARWVTTSLFPVQTPLLGAYRCRELRLWAGQERHPPQLDGRPCPQRRGKRPADARRTVGRGAHRTQRTRLLRTQDAGTHAISRNKVEQRK